jgi:hypothetical protein
MRTDYTHHHGDGPSPETLFLWPRQALYFYDPGYSSFSLLNLISVIFTSDYGLSRLHRLQKIFSSTHLLLFFLDVGGRLDGTIATYIDPAGMTACTACSD